MKPKILIQARYDLFTRRGGDTLQVEKPMRYLNDIGFEIDIDLESQADISKYDLVHLYGITRVHETYMQMLKVIEAGKPYVLSPIYNSYKDYDNYIRHGTDSIISKIYKIIPSYNCYQLLRSLNFCLENNRYKEFIYQLITTFQSQQKIVLENARIVLPNSETEAVSIESELNITMREVKVIPNGVEVEKTLIDVSPDLFYKKYGLKNFILCVGRIEPFKNQLNLIKCLKEEQLLLVFVGEMQNKHKKYVHQFREQLSGKIKWLGKFNREMLFSAYKNSKVVAIPSWSETCGLTGLEASLFKSNIVVTDRGYTKWYYNNNAWYCDPNNLDSIRNSVLEAFNAQRGIKEFSKHITKHFSWEQAALLQKEAYLNALN